MKLYCFVELCSRIFFQKLHSNRKFHLFIGNFFFYLFVGFGSHSYSTVIPIDLAVPSIIFTAASISRADTSTIFFSAISRTCALVTFPTFTVFGVFEPLVTPAAFFKNSAAGGVLSFKSIERSA